MKINVHTHVFNLKSAMTREAVRVFLGRLKSRNLPTYLTVPLESFLKQALDEGVDENMTEGTALAEILRRVALHKDFQLLSGKDLGKELAKQLEKLVPVAESGQGLEILKVMFAAIVKSGSDDAEKDANESTVLDFIEFLRINFLPSIDAVTDELISQSGPEDVLVVLPMDIIDEKASPRDKGVYRKQLDGTVAQAVRYPGRILPFVNVNPRRGPDSGKIFEEFIQSGACVGVKLYPSLGYDVDTPELREVYKTCEAKEVPVLLHCNAGGFRKSVGDAQRCKPGHWRQILDDFPKLKVCFAHFGGDENLIVPGITPNSWTAEILQMMGDFPGQVFADVAYHTACMGNKVVKKVYQKNLKEILANDVTRTQVLWGTDFHLVRQQLQDRNYIRYFEGMFTATEIRRIAVENPQRFLGLPSAEDKTIGANLKRHVGYLNKMREDVSGSGAWWLRAYLKESALPLAEKLAPTSWERNNLAHNYLAFFLWSRKLQKDAKIPSYITESLRKSLADRYPAGSDDLFHAIGDLRMGELVFHLGNPGTGNSQKVAIRGFVSNLQKILTAPNWGGGKAKNSESSKSQIFDAMVEVAEKPAEKVAALGGIVSRFYSFKVNIA